nr:ribonuclease H-like domain, reverse transcriptase, RNA-dependent DNA polymerase [Tanacetum cinerariifolium]
RGAIDKTLFIKQDKTDIMLVQVYVDDIIFVLTKKSWCDEFEELMNNSVKTASTPIETQKPLVKDEEAVDVDVHLYRLLEVTTAKQRSLVRFEVILLGLRNFMCWFSNHTSNGYKFTMSNLHQELASPGANGYCALVLKPPPGMNLAVLWHQQSSALPQTRSLTSQ